MLAGACGPGVAACEDVAAVGGSSNGRTSGFGPENRGSNPCPPAIGPSSICLTVAAPTVLILAAGQGTRMRSNTPKALHELCGRPMVLWPVQAALEAGAGRVVVVDSPGRALEPLLPQGVEVAVQPRADGTGGAVAQGRAAAPGAGQRARGAVSAAGARAAQAGRPGGRRPRRGGPHARARRQRSNRARTGPEAGPVPDPRAPPASRGGDRRSAR